jgi:hypothetical protein
MAAVMIAGPGVPIGTTGWQKPANPNPVVRYPYYGVYPSGSPCAPSADPGVNCVQWFVGSYMATPCDPTVTSDCNPASKPLTGQQATQASDVYAASQRGPLGYMTLWFTDPSAAMQIVTEISQLGKMELGALGFLPVWLEVMILPVAGIVAAIYAFSGKKEK